MTRSAPAKPRPSAGLVVAAPIVALILFGCSTAGASPTTAVASSPIDVPDGSISVPSGAETEPGEIDPPIDYTPDQFWAMMATVPDFEPRTGSLGEALDSAELVVVGRAIDVVEFGGYGAADEPTPWYAEAVIEVSEILKGRPGLDDSGLLRIPFAVGMTFDDTFPTHVLKDFQRSMAKGSAVLLLTSWATYFESTGGDVPKWLASLDRTDLYKTIGPEGAMRITASGIAPPLAEGWPQEELRELSLADLMNKLSVQSSTP